MIDCAFCKSNNDFSETSSCNNCRHGENFERVIISEPVRIKIRDGVEYCGHCGYISDYAKGYAKFYCIRCGGLNLRSWSNNENFGL